MHLTRLFSLGELQDQTDAGMVKRTPNPGGRLMILSREYAAIRWKMIRPRSDEPTYKSDEEG